MINGEENNYDLHCINIGVMVVVYGALHRDAQY